jgi:hypothetical protein
MYVSTVELIIALGQLRDCNIWDAFPENEISLNENELPINVEITGKQLWGPG